MMHRRKYNIGTNGELFSMKRKRRYFEINCKGIDKNLL